MYLVKTPTFVQKFLPGITWKSDQSEKAIYLTFDDGPIPEVTPWVLDTLQEFDAKATFFCVGENIDKNPEIFQRIMADGHSLGNHTQYHIDGWNTSKEDYLNDIFKCAKRVRSNLFRPPYGRMTKKQYSFIKKHYEIILWDVLSGDFDSSLSPDDCLDNVIENSTSGSIIVFHDSLKSRDNLQYVLPKALTHFANKGYRFRALRERPIKEEAQFKHYLSFS